MRLTLRFLALILLIVIATFANSSSRITFADEADNPCFEGCVRGYDICKDRCGLNAGCVQKCESDRMTCEAKCKAGDFDLPKEPPAN